MPLHEPTAIEDFGREHGLLNRVLLIYEEIIDRFNNNISFDKTIILKSAGIIRTFIEDYHEVNEEKFIFPKLLENNVEVAIVKELIRQHKVGRILTTLILKYNVNDPNKKLGKVIDYIKMFIKLYRYHESREDTVIFQAFKNLTKKKEYKELGDEFEESEKKILGKGGFEKILDNVITIEKSLNIFDLSILTDKLIKEGVTMVQ